jgi:hypothetical protein
LWRSNNEWRCWNGDAYTGIPRWKLHNAIPKNACITQWDMALPSH